MINRDLYETLKRFQLKISECSNDELLTYMIFVDSLINAISMRRNNEMIKKHLREKGGIQ